ncbi:hypothetical protein [Actinocorallia aurantiaca]|uniref:hypothetical protein n=1 Tax=Actinocorallia aurantiaca TaxID=46204 RepID=UPI0031D58276
MLVLAATALGAADPTDEPAASPSPSVESPSPSPSPSQTPSPSTPPGDDGTVDEPDDDTDGDTGADAPQDEPTETPAATPELYIVLSVPDPVVRPGDEVKATAHVYAAGAVAKAAKLKVTASDGAEVSPTCTLAAGTCSLGDVTSQGDFVPVTLSVPATAAPGPLRVTTSVSARSAAAKTVVHLLTIEKKSAPAPATSTPSTSTPDTTSPAPAAPSAEQPAQPPVPPGTTPPYSALPSDTSQATLPNGSSPESTDGQLPVVVDSSAQPLNPTQNVAAIRPGPADDADGLIRVQAVWLGMLLALFGALFVQLKRPVRGTHRRLTRGRFAR